MIFGEYSSNANKMMLPQPDRIIFQNESFKRLKQPEYAPGLGLGFASFEKVQLMF